MADTRTVDIDNLGWTDISQGDTSGFLTNEGDTTIMYRQSDTAPLVSEKNGHSLHPASDAVNFRVTTPERIYARSIAPRAQVIVTP